MYAIALDVLPIFLLIFIGYASVRIGLVGSGVGDGLGDFVFNIALPVLLFRTVAEARLDGQQPWMVWAAYFAGAAITWAAGEIVVTRFFDADARIGVLAGLASAFANNLFIGLPLVQRIVGQQGVVALTILISVHLPVMMVVGTLLMERAERRAGGEVESHSLTEILRQVVRNLVRNPLIVGLFLGALVRIVGVPLGGVAKTVVDQIGGVAGSAALMSLGMALRKYGISEGFGPALVTSTFKLFLLPATVYLATHLIGLGADWSAALVLTAAVPTGINVWLIANRFGVGQGLASSSITITTAIGVVTVTFWTWVVGG